MLLAAAGCANIDNPDGWAGPVQGDDDTLFLTPDNGELAAVDPESFDALWLFPAADEVVCGDSPQARERDLRGIYGQPMLDDSSVYVAGYDGFVYSLDREDGACNWAFDTGDPIAGGLALIDDTIYVGSDNSLVYALDTSGQVVAEFDTGESVWVTPLVQDGVVYVTNVDGQLYALDAETLEPVWDEPFEVDGGLISDPILAGPDTLIVGGIGETLYAVDPVTGEERWSYGASNWFWATPLYDEESGVIYAPSLDGNVYALTLEGEEVWQFEAEHGLRSAPLLVNDDTLIVIDREGNVYGLDPAEGVGLWPAPAQLGDTVLSDPIAFDESILIVARGGDVFQLNQDGGGLRQIEVSTA